MDRRAFLRTLVIGAGATVAFAATLPQTVDALPVTPPDALPPMPAKAPAPGGRAPDGTEVEQVWHRRWHRPYWRRRVYWHRRRYWGRRWRRW